MSKLSFTSFCVSYYADHIGKRMSEVYDIFRQEGLLQLLRDDYDDLHGMSMEYLMQFCDEYLGRASG